MSRLGRGPIVLVRGKALGGARAKDELRIDSRLILFVLCVKVTKSIQRY